MRKHALPARSLVRAFFAPAVLATAAIASPALAAPRVEVTRFHTPESLARLSPAAPIAVVMNGGDPASLEQEVWRAAVARALASHGLAAAVSPATAAPLQADVRVERRTWKPERERGGVSVGVGGSTGSYGSGVGLGIGINLGGGSRTQTETTLSVTIRDKASGQSLWEGRAVQTVKASSANARADKAAQKLADALFTGFPGKSGETISVK